MAAGISVVFLIFVNIYFHKFPVVVFNSILVRLQPPDAAAVRKPDQQESDITIQETSNHTPHGRNGSVAQANGETSIHSITQSASRGNLNRGSMARSVRSPVLTILPKHRLEHVPDRCCTYRFTCFCILSEPLLQVCVLLLSRLEVFSYFDILRQSACLPQVCNMKLGESLQTPHLRTLQTLD